MLETVTVLRGELGAPHRGVIPVLAARSDTAGPIPRTVSLLTELSCDLQPHGWRIRRHTSKESRAAEALLASDINVVADVIGAEDGGDHSPVTIEFVGPISLAAQLYLHHGERVVQDHGARRDVGEAMADGMGSLIPRVRQSLEGRDVVVRLDESWLHRTVTGQIPTASGYRTLRAVARAEAMQTLRGVAEAARAQSATVEILVSPEQDPREIDEQVADAVLLNHPGSDPHAWEPVAAVVDSGRGIGVLLPELTQGAQRQPLPRTGDLVRSITRPWRSVGLAPALLDTVSVAPGPGLEHATPDDVRRALELATDLAHGLHHTAQEA